MNSIQIKGKIPIFFGWFTITVNRDIQAPSTWNELSRAQLYKVVDLLTSNQYLRDGKIRLVHVLLNIKSWLFFKLTPEQIQDLTPITEFLLKDNELTTNLVPWIKIESIIYHGPRSFLANLSIEEFGFADTFYTKYKATRKDEFLRALCAALYRREVSSPTSDEHRGDNREQFNMHSVFPRSDVFKALTFAQKYAVCLFYEGCRNWITKKYPLPFSKEKPKGKSFGWGGVLLELAGNKFGDHDQTKKTNLMVVLNHLEMEAIKAIKMKAEHKKLVRKYAKRR